ncbi:hypothetical protein RKD48_000920 [Streptomyces ambofaciens]
MLDVLDALDVSMTEFGRVPHLSTTRPLGRAEGTCCERSGSHRLTGRGRGRPTRKDVTGVPPRVPGRRRRRGDGGVVGRARCRRGRPPRRRHRHPAAERGHHVRGTGLARRPVDRPRPAGGPVGDAGVRRAGAAADQRPVRHRSARLVPGQRPVGLPVLPRRRLQPLDRTARRQWTAAVDRGPLRPPRAPLVAGREHDRLLGRRAGQLRDPDLRRRQRTDRRARRRPRRGVRAVLVAGRRPGRLRGGQHPDRRRGPHHRPAHHAPHRARGPGDPPAGMDPGRHRPWSTTSPTTGAAA